MDRYDELEGALRYALGSAEPVKESKGWVFVGGFTTAVAAAVIAAAVLLPLAPGPDAPTTHAPAAKAPAPEAVAPAETLIAKKAEEGRTALLARLEGAVKDKPCLKDPRCAMRLEALIHMVLRHDKIDIATIYGLFEQRTSDSTIRGDIETSEVHWLGRVIREHARRGFDIEIERLERVFQGARNRAARVASVKTIEYLYRAHGASPSEGVLDEIAGDPTVTGIPGVRDMVENRR